jgi:hypothetical protein
VGAERFRDGERCDQEPEPDLRKSEQRGRGLAREIALSLLKRQPAKRGPRLGGLITQFPLFVTPFPQQKITRSTSIPVAGE